MSKERDALASISRALRALAAEQGLPVNAGSPSAIAVPRARLLAMAATIDKSLAMNVWEQTPSWAEWKDRVLADRKEPPA